MENLRQGIEDQIASKTEAKMQGDMISLGDEQKIKTSGLRQFVVQCLLGRSRVVGGGQTQLG